MSQRLYIGKTDKDWYDCVINRVSSDIPERLAREWLSLEPGNPFFLGPWRVFISDFALFREVDSMMQQVFDRVGRNYPDCVWDFTDVSHDDHYSDIEHPNTEQLAAWVESRLDTKAP